MFALLKQYRELVITLVLLALPFATYLSHAKRGRDLNAFDRAVLTATGPIEHGLMSAVGHVQDAWAGYVALRGVREENLKLRAQTLHLQDENLSLQEAKAENERLRQMLDFAKAQPSPAVAAQVVGTGLAPLYQSITIARGDADGLKKGMAVATPAGVIGKIQDVHPHSADVLLITDVNSAIAVETQKSRARATVRGAGEAKRCKLDFAERAALIEDGDLLISAGTDGVFPKGLAVGRVTHLDHKKSGWTVTGEVDPAVDLSTVEEVLVLTQPPVGRDAVPQAQADKLTVQKAGVLP